MCEAYQIKNEKIIKNLIDTFFGYECFDKISHDVEKVNAILNIILMETKEAS